MSDLTPFKKNNLNRIDDFFTQFLKNFFDDGLFTSMNFIGGNFKVDMKETDDNFIVVADLPGIKKEAININLANNYLTISAKRDEGVEGKRENYVRKERHYGEFSRSIFVDNVDENRIVASFSDGVLKIILPKLNKGSERKRRIDIR